MGKHWATIIKGIFGSPFLLWLFLKLGYNIIKNTAREGEMTKTFYITDHTNGISTADLFEAFRDYQYENYHHGRDDLVMVQSQSVDDINHIFYSEMEKAKEALFICSEGDLIYHINKYGHIVDLKLEIKLQDQFDKDMEESYNATYEEDDYNF